MPGSFRLAFAAAAACAVFAPASAGAQVTAPPASLAPLPARDDWQRIDSTHTPEGWICVNRTRLFDTLGFRHLSGARCNGDTPPGLIGAAFEGWVDCARDRSQNVEIWLNAPAADRPRPQPRLYARNQLGAEVADAVCRGL